MIGEDLQKFSGSRVMRTIAIGRVPIRNLSNICDVYPTTLDIRKCERWFSRFRLGNIHLFDSSFSGKVASPDDDVLWVEMEESPCHTIGELSNKLITPWSII
ncbi:hypothetical protein AVEN_2289-1 [Araneus ventricosus]|uniref:Mos1 transposase HTH domain-containing protein n=1 Tax=Araneus ventricosus TaxID=182803 RepID=A0A4Y2JH84_ARAVE|nr:hypothetical protein AVEN_2289-1 [Araneus ventricosus]